MPIDPYPRPVWNTLLSEPEWSINVVSILRCKYYVLFSWQKKHYHLTTSVISSRQDNIRWSKHRKQPSAEQLDLQDVTTVVKETMSNRIESQCTCDILLSLPLEETNWPIKWHETELLDLDSSKKFVSLQTIFLWRCIFSNNKPKAVTLGTRLDYLL